MLSTDKQNSLKEIDIKISKSKRIYDRCPEDMVSIKKILKNSINSLEDLKTKINKI